MEQGEVMDELHRSLLNRLIVFITKAAVVNQKEMIEQGGCFNADFGR